MTTDVELLLCPFCGGTNIGEDWVTTYSVDSSYAVFGCRDCGARYEDGGPNEWNRRYTGAKDAEIETLKRERLLAKQKYSAAFAEIVALRERLRIRDSELDYARGQWEKEQARNERLRAEVERLKSMTAVTMGVGTGDGNLFVHGDYESIKAAQEIVLERDALRADVGRLQRKAAGAIDAARSYQRELAAEYVRAERLAEALRKISELDEREEYAIGNARYIARHALRNEQEEGRASA